MLQELAERLAANRIAGIATDLPIARLRSADEALMVQSAALEAYDSDFEGYAVVGTSLSVRRTLGLERPIYSAIPGKALHDAPATVRLPRGMLGAQCELAFTIGRTYPVQGETIDRASAADAIVACQPAIGLLGRRTRPVGDSHLAAIADFAFHVATICGPSASHIDPRETDGIKMVARINGNVVATAEADAVLSHPLEAVMWLARQLAADHKTLNAGDIVTTGSFAPILQVLPGQELKADFAALGAISCTFA